MTKTLLTFSLFTLLLPSAQAGDAFRASQSVLKLFSESAELRAASGALGIEQLIHLDSELDIPHEANTRYKLLLGRKEFPERKKCLLVTLMGRELLEIQTCETESSL